MKKMQENGIIYKSAQYPYIYSLHPIGLLNKNNIQLSRLSGVAVIAASLLSVAIITELSIAEEADARKKSSSKTITKQTITQKNIDGRYR
jgi:hypothetical protein